MTNDKMPVVGRIYTHKITGELYEAFKHKARENCYFMESQSSAVDLMVTLDGFWSEYEDLAESPEVNANLQETAQSEISEKGNGSCFNKGGENEISEVDKTLGELKFKIRYVVDNVTGTMIPIEHITFDKSKEHVIEMIRCAQNLINAMEAEKSKLDSQKGQSVEAKQFDSMKETPESPKVKEKPIVGDTYTHLGTRDKYILVGIDSDDNAICLKLDSRGNIVVPRVSMGPLVSRFWEVFLNDCDGGKEVKAEKKVEEESCNLQPIKEFYKEPEEMPKSLWKDVSELPDHSLDVVLQTDEGEMVFARFHFYDQLFKHTSFAGDIPTSYSNTYIKRYCALTDFINAFEQLQRDVEELKKGRKNV
jgi:hypothetical protein